MFEIEGKGYVAADAELRAVNQGGQTKKVANFAILHTPRIRQADGSYIDGEVQRLNVSAWSSSRNPNFADNVAASVKRGLLVKVKGRAKARAFSDKNSGEARASLDCEATEVSMELDKAVVSVTKNAPRQQGESAPAATSAPAAAPAATQAAAPAAAPVQLDQEF